LKGGGQRPLTRPAMYHKPFNKQSNAKNAEPL